MKSLTDFPTELLTDIFIRLDYFTLNINIRASCRRFHDIIKFTTSPELLTLLYRYRELSDSTATKEDRKIVRHPAFQLLSTDYGVFGWHRPGRRKIEDVGFYVDESQDPRTKRLRKPIDDQQLWKHTKLKPWRRPPSNARTSDVDKPLPPLPQMRFIPFESTNLADEVAVYPSASSIDVWIVIYEGGLPGRYQVCAYKPGSPVTMREVVDFVTTKLYNAERKDKSQDIRLLNMYLTFEDPNYPTYPFKAKAIYSFIGNGYGNAAAGDEKELSFRKYEILQVRDVDRTWWSGRNVEGEIGIIPSNYFMLFP